MKGFDHPDTTRTWDQLYYGDPLSIRFYDVAIRRVLDLLRPESDDRVLDAGCGAGVHAVRAAKAGFRVDAIDFSESALRDAAARAREAGVADRLKFNWADLTHLDLPSASYRRIFSWGVLIHIPEIEKAMDELVRILADGGRLALYVSNYQAAQTTLGRLRRRITGKQGGWQRLPMGWATRADLHGESIWVWFNDVDAIVSYLEKRGLRLIARQAGEFSDWHLRLTGYTRRVFLALNNLWLFGRLPARLAYMNLLVFEKSGPGSGTQRPV